ncbi:MAG: ShlB/FhaC/HecB family hemolysin secretion/activation protein [Veillonellales bacterium]
MKDVMLLLLQGVKKMVLFLGVVLILATVSGARAAERPTAGSVLEETKQSDIKPAPPPGEAKIQVEQALRPPLIGGSAARISVSRFHITGQDIFPEQELLNLLPEPKGKELSLPEIESLGRSITNFFHKNGYIMAGVYVPAQQIKDGVVELAVVVGQYDKIVFRKQVNIADDSLALQLGEVKSGAYIKKDSLERAIWLLGDLAGIEAKATLAPGGKPGTANLYLDILPKGKGVSGDIGADNYGNRFTGKNQLFTDLTVNNLSANGDQLTLNGITTGSGLNSGSIFYQQPLFIAGGYLQAGYSHLYYELGEDYASLNASGIADTGNISYKYTFHRSREANLYGQFGYVQKKLRDSVGGTGTDKSSHAWVVSLNGDSFDAWGGGGNNTYSLAYSYGQHHIDSDSARANDAKTAQTTGTFGKWNMTASRHQYLNEHLSLVTFLSGQLASKNLDSSEKMSLGGAYGVRAYPQGEASGDNALLFNGELHWTVPMKDKKAELLQLVGFIDIGRAVLNKNTWPNSGPNARTLKGAGVGAVWNNPGILTIKAYYAWKLNSSPSTSDTDKNGRLWLIGIRYF